MALAATSAVAQISFEGNSKPVYQEGESTSTGEMAVYVLYSAQGVSMSYTAHADPNNVSWQSFTVVNGGRIYNDISVVSNGDVTTLPQVVAGQGYLITEGDVRTYLWVIDYSTCRMRLNSVVVEPESDCGTTVLNVDGYAPEMRYDVNKSLDREIEVIYHTLEWNAEDTRWDEVDVVEKEKYLKTSTAVPAPYCNTTFTISGDKFLEFWGEKISKTSDTYSAVAISVETTAIQEERDHDNEQKSEGVALGGSAPAVITFTAYCTDAVSFKQWQVSDNPDFNYILMDFSQDEVEYTFEEMGTTYWRFYYANSDGSCEDYSETYTVNIGESQLICPNIFSPGTTEGVNDVWKVSYKSIVDFHCWIYNRWGVLIKEFTDPSDGWDGTYRGKLVSTGVYFYVIRATGSDGKKYKESGDINILRYERRNSGGSSDIPEE